MIDTHAHINFPDLAGQLADVLQRAREAGVKKIVIPGTSRETSVSGVNMAEQEEGVFAAAGIHPCHAHEYTDEDRVWMKELLQETNNLVSIGEVGLDYYHFEDCPDERAIENRKAIQADVFKEMIDWAKQYDLPLIIHAREAFEDTHAMLAKEAADHPTVIHCFTGSADQADAYLQLGCMLSVTGIITYPKNEAMREVVRRIPMDRLMVETDSPYLAPQSVRGKLCEPAYVMEVARCVAEVKGMTLEEIDRITTENAERFFRIG